MYTCYKSTELDYTLYYDHTVFNNLLYFIPVHIDSLTFNKINILNILIMLHN